MLNIPASQDCMVSLSTFDQQAEACAVRCVELLLNHLRNNAPLQSVELRAGPIWRESTRRQ